MGASMRRHPVRGNEQTKNFRWDYFWQTLGGTHLLVAVWHLLNARVLGSDPPLNWEDTGAVLLISAMVLVLPIALLSTVVAWKWRDSWASAIIAVLLGALVLLVGFALGIATLLSRADYEDCA